MAIRFSLSTDTSFKDLAGVNMRLEAGAIRELHWHTAAEWAYVLSGTMQVSTVTSEGQNYVGNAVRTAVVDSDMVC